MDLEIREFRASDQEQARSLLLDNGPVDGDLEHLNLLMKRPSGLSVVASKQGRIIGATLGNKVGRFVEYFVLTATRDDETKLAQRMLDKALLKLLATGMTKCRIITPGTVRQSFWESVRWQSDSD